MNDSFVALWAPHLAFDRVSAFIKSLINQELTFLYGVPIVSNLSLVPVSTRYFVESFGVGFAASLKSLFNSSTTHFRNSRTVG